MNDTHSAPAATLSEDDVQTCVRVLKAIEANRGLLTTLSQDQRRELLTLAGLVSKPERHNLVRMAKAFRRAEREAAKEHDRKAIEQAGLRVQRRASEYTPLWLEPPKPEDLAEQPELSVYPLEEGRRTGGREQPMPRIHVDGSQRIGDRTRFGRVVR